MVDDEEPPNEDELKMFAMYQEFGGKSDEEEYMLKMRTFVKYTLNSFIFGECLPDDLTTYKGPMEDETGHKFFRNRDEAADAYMEAVKIDVAEYNRIFESIDSLYGWT